MADPFFGVRLLRSVELHAAHALAAGRVLLKHAREAREDLKRLSAVTQLMRDLESGPHGLDLVSAALRAYQKVKRGAGPTVN